MKTIITLAIVMIATLGGYAGNRKAQSSAPHSGTTIGGVYIAPTNAR